ncbi:MAG: transcriptional repressor LexA [Candidatus Obscuribacter sp.]|nr:transcriptional repressor LexA [Candidatus Obscuribacter sp.]
MELTKPLPTRQKEVLSLIASFTEAQGYPPTLADLANSLGLKNRMTVHQHVAALRKKGLVHWEPGLNRSLRVLPEGFVQLGRAVEGASDVAPASPVSKASAKTIAFPARPGIPLAGAIAAGNPIDAIQGDDFLEVESRYGDSDCYALKVKGESMIEDGIYDGDFVIIKPEPSPNNGDVVVALLEDGSATLKRFFKEKGGYRLQPANASMEPIFVSGESQLTIQGKVVGLFRNMH